MKKICMVLLLGVVLVGCAGMNKTQQGALLGAGTGAAIGQIAGGDTKSTLIGAGIGGVTGALAGDYMQKQQNQSNAMNYNQGYNSGYQQGYQQQRYIASGQEPPMDRQW